MSVITGPGELVALVPSMLGFQPTESVVVVLVRDRGEVAAVMRLDGGDMLGDEAPDIGTALARHAAHESTRRAVVLVFMEDSLEGGKAADRAVAALEETVACVEAWLISDGRYFCPDCVDPTCCPPGGRAIPDSSGTNGGDWRTWRSSRASRSSGATRARADVRRLCARAAARWERRAENDVEGWRRESARLWLEALDHGAEGPAPLGRLAAALADVRVRDAVLLALVPGADAAVDDALAGHDSDAIAAALGAGMRPARPPDEERAARLSATLEHLLALAPARLCAPPAAVHGVLEWWRGDAGAARAWCRIALDRDPGYRLSLLTLALIDTVGAPE